MKNVLRVGSRDVQLGCQEDFWIIIRSSVPYEGRRILGNVPAQGMVNIRRIDIDGEAVVDDWIDGYLLSRVGGLCVDIPVPYPSCEVYIRGEYTGLTPPPFYAGCYWKLSFAIHGFTK